MMRVGLTIYLVLGVGYLLVWDLKQLGLYGKELVANRALEFV